MNPASHIPRRLLTTACFLIAVISAAGCAAISREPGLPSQPTGTTPASTPTPTPRPVIEVDSLTIKPGGDPDSWQIIGQISNISGETLNDIELQISILNPDGSIGNQVGTPPALRQLAPGGSTPFKASIQAAANELKVEDVRVEISSYNDEASPILKIDVERTAVRSNIEGGTTYLGHFANPGLDPGEILNVEAYILNEDGEPIDSAESIATISSVGPRRQVPFRVDFRQAYDQTWPEFFINAVPVGDSDGSEALWLVQQPRLFFTSQKVPVYLIEIKNNAFAPQTLEGLLTLNEGDELVAVLPLRSPSLIPPQGSWFTSVQPSLELPTALRNDENAIRELIPEVIIDPIASHGVTEELTSLELEVEKVETIGGSLFLQGSLQNMVEMDLYDAVVHASLRDSTGTVISANSSLVAEMIDGGGSREFLISLWLPEGTDANMLEFDLYADAVDRQQSNRSSE